MEQHIPRPKKCIKFYVKDDANLRGEGLNAASAAAAVGKAAETWDSVACKNLFSDSGVTATGYNDPNLRPIPMTERTWQAGSISLQRAQRSSLLQNLVQPEQTRDTLLLCY